MSAHIPKIIDFAGINNGLCDYSYELLNDPSLTPSDPSIFTISQPTLTSVVGATDPRIKSVIKSGNLTISATNAQIGVYNLLLKVKSNKNIYDLNETSFRFAVTINAWACTPGFTSPTL